MPKTLEFQYIESLVKRLESYLPNVTGYSLIEVELNPQFITTKNLLVKRVTPDASEYLSSCFSVLCSLLDSINKDSHNLKLREKDDKILSSLLIILKILSRLIKFYWQSKTSLSNFNHEKFSSNFEILSNFSFYYYFEPPQPLDPDHIAYFLDTLTDLMSGEIIKKVVNLIQKRPIDENKYYSTKPDEEVSNIQSYINSNISHDEEINVTSVVNEIDLNIEICLRFLATANPKEYYNYLYNNLFKFSNHPSQSFPRFALAKFSPLIKLVFYTEMNGLKMAQCISKTLEVVKNNTWRQIVLTFYAVSIRDQSFSRPIDYTQIVEGNDEVIAVCKSVFDLTVSVFDEFPNSGVSSMVESWISFLSPSDYRDYDKRPNKLKINFNKRLKFINGLLKDANNKSNLTCFDSLVNLFHLAGRFPDNLKNHPMYVFALAHLDTTYENLTNVNLQNYSTNQVSYEITLSYDNLLVNFFVSAIMLKPQKYVEILIQKFNDLSDSFRDVRIIIKIIRSISELNDTHQSFMYIMKKISPALKSMTFNASKLLNQHYEAVSNQSLSDRISVSSKSVDESSSGVNFEDLKISSTTLSSSASSIASSTSSRVLILTEETLTDLFSIFTATPELFFNDFKFMQEDIFYSDEDHYRQKIKNFVYDNITCLKAGLQSKTSSLQDNATADNRSESISHGTVGNEELSLFSSTCSLIMTMVCTTNLITKDYNEVTAFCNFITCNFIVKVICDSCLTLSLTDPRFKSNLIFLNEFITKWDSFFPLIENNKIIADPRTHSDDPIIVSSIERVLLFSLCTHDIQFYNIAKDTIKWYLRQAKSKLHPDSCFQSNMVPTFTKIVEDDYIFTGFVSLHKRFRNLLRDSKPTQSLYQIWVVIYERWMYLIENSNLKLNEDNLLFRHFTGFLVSTSGCFLLDDFANEDLELKLKSESYVSDFFDKCIELLNSQDLIVRVIIKDALSNESHSSVYNLISSKLIDVVVNFEENRIINEESTLFTEQVITIVTAMIAVDNDGAVVLTALLPDICLVLIKVINLIDNPINCDRLKLRFCKLVITIETNRARLLLAGGYKIRNFFAKSMCDWLEQAAFFDELGHLQYDVKSSNSSVSSRNKDSELAYINIDLANESSKALSLQLEELILEIPEGTSDSDIAKYKDLAFANYFSLFYKILTKYTQTSTKSKYKVQLITDNVLKCITNMLQYDTDVGLQFVFPLGYHENYKIRALFLNVFASMLYERKLIKDKSEYSNETFKELASSYDIIRASSQVASSNSHSLFANAAYGVYGYAGVLDKVFEILIDEEINNVSRTADIFRRNSILTKLLAKLARDEGISYLTFVLKDFIEEFTTKDIIFNNEEEDSDAEIYLSYLTRLVDLIVNSIDLMPKSFRFICHQIHTKVSEKVPDSGLIAVGSFLFLRFFCPAIISPESFFEVDVIGNTNKKSLLQLVKLLQNMANKTLSVLKWKSLNDRMGELDILTHKIFDYLEKASVYNDKSYPFAPISETPVAEARFLHKFTFTYYKEIKASYLLGDFSETELRRRVEVAHKVDQLLKDLGQPKHLLNMPNHEGVTYKSFDTLTTGVGLSNEYNEFMAKMTAKYGETPIDVSVIHNSIFHDGSPVVVINLSTLRFIEFNVELLVYKLFETASQVWDNKFYFVFDFTGFSTEMHLLIVYATLLNTYAPPQLFKNCCRIYYFNIPVNDVSLFLSLVKPSKVENKDSRARFYTYSHCDSVEIISSLCLSEYTMSITRDKKVEFNNCKVLDAKKNIFKPVTVRIGRQFLLLCSDEFVATDHELCATKGFRPVEIFSLGDVTRCEITGSPDEFTIFFTNNSCVIRSPDRSEILRFLYFTTSRLPKNFIEDDDKYLPGDISNLWFGRLFNITFQSLLNENEDVRTSASALFASVAHYFDIDYHVSRAHATSVAYPINATDFIVAISRHLSVKFPHMSYRFLRAFFDSYDKVPPNRRMDAILYVAPWVKNICGYIYLENEQYGPDRVAGLIRHFCHISAINKSTISVINDYIWKQLFADPVLVPTLLDEIVTFAMDTRNDDPDWSFIISVLTPSVELCGEVIKRLIVCVSHATSEDSDIASESKLFEIMILVKICSSLFFDSFIYAQLYLADVFFLCTLFIDNPWLEFGADLQKLVINTVESFLHKPDLTASEQKVVEETLTYFTSQRVRMLFGLTRDKNTGSSDITQLYNRAAGFETLCDYLNEFITVLGSADDRSGWRARWSSIALDVAFVNSSLFQARAILVVGILSKTGINDQSASRMLKLMSKHAFNNTLEYMTTVLMSAARVFEGLASDSIFPPLMIWPQLYFGMLNYASLYQASIQCLLNTLLKNFEQGYGEVFVQRIFEQRQYLLPFISSFESAHNFHIDEKNVLVYIFFIFTQGLKLSHIKHTSLMCMKTIFKYRVKREAATDYEVPSGTIPYLFFIWLSSNDQSFEEYLATVDYTPSVYVHVGKFRIPQVVVDFILGDSLYGMLTLYQGAYHYATDTVEDRFRTKFLYVYNHIFKMRKEKGLMVYHIIKDAIDNAVVNNNSIEIVELLAEVQSKVIASPSYSLEESYKATDEFLKKHGLMIIKDYKFRKLSDLLKDDDNMRQSIERDNERLQEMIYRTAACYVDSSRLEN